MLELLARLSDAFGPSGFEDEVRATLEEWCRPFADEVVVDPFGTLRVTIEGRGSGSCLVTAHMDETGFQVSHIDDSGFVRLAELGEWGPAGLESQPLTFLTDAGERVNAVSGHVGSWVLEDAADRVRSIDSIVVDLGVETRAQSEALGIRIGTPAVPSTRFRELGAGRVTGKALDDRVGCAIVASAARRLAEDRPDVSVTAAFTVAEELDSRAAAVAAREAGCEIALVVEGTSALDLPDVEPQRATCSLGGGAAIYVGELTYTVPRRFVSALIDVARRMEIAHQLRSPGAGAGTDAAGIAGSGRGIPTGVVGVPCRYLHSFHSVADVRDIEATVRLVESFVRDSRVQREIVAG